MTEVMKIGIIGCGNISWRYFESSHKFPSIEIKSCSDINMEAAKAAAEKYGVSAVTTEQMLADPEIEMVINLTNPAYHTEVNLQVLNAGKHVHCEKPIAIDLDDAKKVLALAEEKGLRVGCAPDTFLGAALQTARKVIDDGWIGKPLSGIALFLKAGPEFWHPNPYPFYQKGGGPMFDIGVYYITTLVHLLGPAVSVTAVTGKGFEERRATSDKLFGVKFPAEVPTHYAGVVEFANGTLVTVTISFDVSATKYKNIEIHGTEGSMRVSDPNNFDGDIEVYRPGNEDWQTSAYSHPHKDNLRIIGAADMAEGIRKNRPHRTSGELAYHVLEVMHAFEKSSVAQARVAIESTCVQPAPLELGGVIGDVN